MDQTKSIKLLTVWCHVSTRVDSQMAMYVRYNINHYDVFTSVEYTWHCVQEADGSNTAKALISSEFK